MKKVFIVNGDKSYHDLFTSLGFTITRDIEQANLVCFTGGSDVSPEMYGHKKHPATYNDPLRDLVEGQVFSQARKLDIPMVGICRGGQFLNVMSGGEMYQDVTKHGRSHSITDLQTGETIYVSSTHHQMIKHSPEGILVASSNLYGNRDYWDGQVFVLEQSECDNEVVFYPNTKCLCFQPHPEYSAPEYEGMRKYFGELLFRFFEI